MTVQALDYNTDARDVFQGKMACVVAHPDDEVLWAGGLIQKGDWTVICCSVPRHDPIRAYKFFECCEVLGVKSKLLPFSEGEPSALFPHLIALEDLSEFDGVLTHNPTGEYGHLHHRQVHDYVRDNFKGPIWTFGFGEGEFFHKLSEEELNKKVDAIQKYNHVLPYMGKEMEKYKALIHRYMQDQDFSVETFDLLESIMPEWRGSPVKEIKRWHVISDLVEENGWEVGVEVGVKEGENLFFIADQCPDLKITGVDAWEQQLSEEHGEDYRSWNMGSIYDGVRGKAQDYPNITIKKAFSVEAAEDFEDGSLDFVFIDAQHTYDCLKSDVAAWEPKLKPTGTLMGHDIHFPGVLKAVKELFPDYIELENYIWMRP